MDLLLRSYQDLFRERSSRLAIIAFYPAIIHATIAKSDDRFCSAIAAKAIAAGVSHDYAAQAVISKFAHQV